MTGRERPILFSGSMVRALLDGRKTQTRRAIKSQPPTPEAFRGSLFSLDRAIADGVKFYSQNDYDRLPKHPTDWELTGSVGVARSGGFPARYRCPYGQPGDRLWVRETWGLNHYEYERGAIPKARPANLEDQYLAYAATETDSETCRELRWRPSIHMPRWMSRLTLEITEVRAERLHGITEADAIAEGADQYASSTTLRRGRAYDASLNGIYREGFSELWETINGAGSWDANPWVWAVSFKVVGAGAPE